MFLLAWVFSKLFLEGLSPLYLRKFLIFDQYPIIWRLFFFLDLHFVINLFQEHHLLWGFFVSRSCRFWNIHFFYFPFETYSLSALFGSFLLNHLSKLNKKEEQKLWQRRLKTDEKISKKEEKGRKMLKTNLTIQWVLINRNFTFGEN